MQQRSWIERQRSGCLPVPLWQLCPSQWPRQAHRQSLCWTSPSPCLPPASPAEHASVVAVILQQAAVLDIFCVPRRLVPMVQVGKAACFRCCLTVGFYRFNTAVSLDRLDGSISLPTSSQHVLLLLTGCHAYSACMSAHECPPVWR